MLAGISLLIFFSYKLYRPSCLNLSIQTHLNSHCNNIFCFAKERIKFYNWWHHFSHKYDFSLKYSAHYTTSGLMRKMIQEISFTDKIYQINYLLRINCFNFSSLGVKSLINKIYQRELILLVFHCFYSFPWAF